MKHEDLANAPIQRPSLTPGNMADHGDSPVSCLLVHGLGGGPYELEPLARRLEQSGRFVLSLTLPGHEKDHTRVMPASRWQDWAQAVEEGFDQLAAFGRPVAVVGFSTGGTLALLLARRRPVARLVLLAPFLSIRYANLVPLLKPENYLAWIGRFFPNIPRFSPPVRDAEARARFAQEERFRTFNLPATLSALELIKRVQPDLPRITTPTLILQGARERVVDPQGARTIYERLGSAEKSLVWLPQSDHLLIHDVDRDLALRESVNFLS